MDSGKNVNKLVLIGNGFDLSLGLDTSYKHFLLWLLKREIKKAIDCPEEIRLEQGANGYVKHNFFEIRIPRNRQIKYEEVEKIENVASILDFLRANGVVLKFEFKLDLFQVILGSAYEGWVDIEGAYFTFIKDILKSSKTIDYIDILNKDLEYLSKELKTYLSQFEHLIFYENEATNHVHHFDKDITIKELYLKDKSVHKIQTNDIYFLNFNYTNTLKKILQFSEKPGKMKINQIHGSLSDVSNPIIFGFGDEMDNTYKELEELNDNRFFKYIKSFHYLKNSNYRKLLAFLDSCDFQVCIYGHSCGLSDRVMLNEIFEHENCVSIKIYHIGENDFSNKTMEISRHFTDNQSMRKRIVEYDPQNVIPQINN